MKKKILVIGDIMLDQYNYGTVQRISPEAPVPVLLENTKKQKSVPGGAANVAVNLKAAGEQVSILSVTGEDENGRKLMDMLDQLPVDTSFMIIDKKRITTTKQRYIGQNNQQILRVDNETDKEVDYNLAVPMIQKLIARAEHYSVIVLSDYGKGFLSTEMIGAVQKAAEQANIPVIADVKGKDKNKYRNLFLVKPNKSELEELMGKKISTLDEVADSAIELCQELNCQYILVTCGAEGMILVNQKGKLRHIASVIKEVYDVTGAGDTVLAYVASGIANQMEVLDALVYANVAAGIQVSKSGTSPVFYEEVEAELMKNMHSKHNKIIGREEAQKLRDKISGKLVFTNGCFDILHIGHVNYLKQAAELGSTLVVGLNSDSSVRCLKGDGRPVNNEQQRSEILAALEMIDYVVVFEEITPYELIKDIQPDVLVKGGDYQVEDIVGRDIVEQRGGSVVTIALVEGVSTTNTIRKISSRN